MDNDEDDGKYHPETVVKYSQDRYKKQNSPNTRNSPCSFDHRIQECGVCLLCERATFVLTTNQRDNLCKAVCSATVDSIVLDWLTSWLASCGLI